MKNEKPLHIQLQRIIKFSRQIENSREEEILNQVHLQISQTFPEHEETINRFLCRVNDLLSAFFSKEKPLSPQEKTVRKAQEYMQKNYNNPVKSQDIAKHAGASVEALCRLFKKQTATTMTAYLNEIRIKHSINLLRETGDSISEIAYSCGFNNPSYYCVTFRQKMKMPPGKWRKFQ